MHWMHRGVSGRRSPRDCFPTLVAALVLAAPVSADVLIKQKTVTEGMGGFANSESHGTLVVSGDKSRSEDQATMTGRIGGQGGSKTRSMVSITRLDKDLVWVLDPAEKRYTEMTFDAMRSQMPSGAARGGNPEQGADMTFSVEVKKTGAHQDISGYPCEEVVITCIGSPKKAEAAGVGETKFVLDQWLTNQAPGADELKAYHLKVAERMGVDPALAGAAPMYGGAIKEMAGRLKDLKGVPIRSTMTVEGGASAEMDKALAGHERELAEADKAIAEANAERDQAMADARAEQAKTEKRASEGDDSAAQDAKDIAAGGGISGKLGGFLGKRLGKAASKKAEKKAEKMVEEKTREMPSAASAGSPKRGGPLFKSVMEVESISTAPAPAGSFEIPAGYTQASAQARPRKG